MIVPFANKGDKKRIFKAKDTIIEEHKNELKKNHTMLIDVQKSSIVFGKGRT